MSTTTNAPAARQDGFVRIIKSSLQQMLVAAALIVVYAFFVFNAPGFAAPSTLPDILLRSASIGIMALGATFVIATGGIDLSAGTGLSLAAVMTAFFLGGKFLNLPLALGLLLAVAFGALVGAVNGFNISILGLPPFIATLGMMLVARGLALVISDTKPMQIENPDFKFFSTAELIPSIPNAALAFVAFTIIAAILLNKTLLGRYALAIGSNEEATRLSGANVKMRKILIYMTAGIFMAAGAIIFSARTGVAQPAEGLGMELDVIAAVVIGGTSLACGRANVFGTFVGALLMKTLLTGLQMMQVNQSWQFVVMGVIVLAAVFVDSFRSAGDVPVTMCRINLADGLGPVIQIAEGWTVELPDEVATAIENRTDRTWFVPNLTGEGPFTSVYDAMNAWGQPRCDQLRPHRGPPHHAGLHDAHPRRHVQRSHRTGLPAEELARLRHRRPGGRGLPRLRPVRPAVRLSRAFPVRESPREPGGAAIPVRGCPHSGQSCVVNANVFPEPAFQESLVTATALAVDLGSSSGPVIAGVLDDDRITETEVHRFPHTAAMRDGYLCWDLDLILQGCQRDWKAAGQVNDIAALVETAHRADSLGAVIDPDDPRYAQPGSMVERVTEALRAGGAPARTSQGQLVRALCESFVERYARGVRDLAALTGQAPTQLNLVGGGSRNTLLCGLTARFLGVPVLAGPAEASTLGSLLGRFEITGALDPARRNEVIAATAETRIHRP